MSEDDKIVAKCEQRTVHENEQYLASKNRDCFELGIVESVSAPVQKRPKWKYAILRLAVNS